MSLLQTSNNLFTTIWTVSAGSLGGLSAVISKQKCIFLTITLNNTIDLLYYTFLSATVAYVGKIGLDWIRKKIVKTFKKDTNE